MFRRSSVQVHIKFTQLIIKIINKKIFQIFRRSSVQVRAVREIFHPTLLTRVTLPQGARRHTRLRLQTAEVEGKQTFLTYFKEMLN